MDSNIYVLDRNFKNNKDSLKGNRQSITCLLSLNSYSFISGSADSQIKLWSDENSIPSTFSQSPHKSQINSLVYKPESNNIIVSSSMDGQIVIWQNTSKLEPKQEQDLILSGHLRQIEQVIYLDNYLIASATDDCSILIWNSNKTITYNLTGHTDNINALTKLFNGNIASCSKDKTVRIWDKQNNYSLKATLYGHLKSVISLKSIDIYQKLVSGSCDKKIIVWNLETNQKEKELIDAHSKCINTFAIYIGAKQEDKYLLSGSDDKKVKQWDLKTFELIKEFTQFENSIRLMASLNDSIFAVNNEDNVTIYNYIPKYDNKYNKNLEGHIERVLSLAIIPSNENIVSGSEDKQ